MDKPDGLSLGPNEKLVWAGNRSFLSFLSSAGKGIKILIGGLILVSVLALVVAVGSSSIEIGESCCGFYLGFFGLMVAGVIMAKMKYQYAITTKRVYTRRGIGARRVNEIPLERIVNTTYNQGFVGRILGFGNLQFNSAAGADQGVIFYGVKNPETINQRFKEVRSKIQKKQPAQQTVNVNMGNSPQPPQPPQQPKQADYEEVKEVPELDKKENKLPEREKETIYCKHCGEEIDADSTFCEECGGKLS